MASRRSSSEPMLPFPEPAAAVLPEAAGAEEPEIATPGGGAPSAAPPPWLRPGVRLGTSAFTAEGWSGSFYPAELTPPEYLEYYSRQFDTVEVDSTFYRTPRPSMVKGWYAKTPAGFVFAAKVPQVITHERCMRDCGKELAAFLRSMDHLGEKLGPLLFQFPYFNARKFHSVEPFLERLTTFLKDLPSGYRFALEVRNRAWLQPRLFDLLRGHGVTLALIDHPWMPRPETLWRDGGACLTGDFAYLRWLGDRYAIEEQTQTWDKEIVDRERELAEWVEVCSRIVHPGTPVFAFANNHFAGHAPATLRRFRELWEERRRRSREAGTA